MTKVDTCLKQFAGGIKFSKGKENITIGFDSEKALLSVMRDGEVQERMSGYKTDDLSNQDMLTFIKKGLINTLKKYLYKETKSHIEEFETTKEAKHIKPTLFQLLSLLNLLCTIGEVNLSLVGEKSIAEKDIHSLLLQGYETQGILKMNPNIELLIIGTESKSELIILNERSISQIKYDIITERLEKTYTIKSSITDDKKNIRSLRSIYQRHQQKRKKSSQTFFTVEQEKIIIGWLTYQNTKPENGSTQTLPLSA